MSLITLIASNDPVAGRSAEGEFELNRVHFHDTEPLKSRQQSQTGDCPYAVELMQAAQMFARPLMWIARLSSSDEVDVGIASARSTTIASAMNMIQPDKLRIVYYPNATLRQRAKEIENVDDTVRAVAERMIELMREADGVGLACPQVGLPWRMFVANARGEDEPDRVYINPTLRDPEGAVEPHEEGCLSLPRIYGDVWRPPAITIEATDLQGERFTMTADGMLARIWQHETDHLDGRLIIDRFGQVDKLANRKRLKELERAASGRTGGGLLRRNPLSLG